MSTSEGTSSELRSLWARITDRFGAASLSIAAHLPPQAAAAPRAASPLEGFAGATCWGTYWFIEHSLHAMAPAVVREWQGAEHLLAEAAQDERLPVDQRAFAAAFPRRTVYLDLETCGFAGSMVFLIGLIHHAPEGFVLRQFLARNYAEEKSILEALWHAMGDKQVLVSFNGKCFDWNMVHDRSTLHHLGRHRFGGRSRVTPSESESHGPRRWTRTDPRPELRHFDLLHHCRRRWRDVLPNCRLQTLEQYVCGRRRVADIPGHAIPAAYHRFVRDGDPREMRSILYHNALDLITLWQLSLRVVVGEGRL